MQLVRLLSFNKSSKIITSLVSVMFFYMFAVCHDFKIFNSVVCFYMIFMMHHFAWRKITANVFFNNKSRTANVISAGFIFMARCINVYIPHVVISHAFKIMRFFSEKRNVITGCGAIFTTLFFHLRRPKLKLFITNLAVQMNLGDIFKKPRGNPSFCCRIKTSLRTVLPLSYFYDSWPYFKNNFTSKTFNKHSILLSDDNAIVT